MWQTVHSEEEDRANLMCELTAKGNGSEEQQKRKKWVRIKKTPISDGEDKEPFIMQKQLSDARAVIKTECVPN